MTKTSGCRHGIIGFCTACYEAPVAAEPTTQVAAGAQPVGWACPEDLVADGFAHVFSVVSDEPGMGPARVPLYAAPLSQQGEHPDNLAVDRFAAALKAKLAQARTKGRGGWDTPECTQQRLSDMLREHVQKGDPRDVANFCMFLWARSESIVQQAPAAVAVTPNVFNALVALYDDYKAMADSGDSGNWRLEDQKVGKQALAAIEAYKSQESSKIRGINPHTCILDDVLATDRCDVPPPGWYCTRSKGHSGPCAAIALEPQQGK